MGIPRKRFRKGDKVIVSMSGSNDERGEVISRPKKWLDSIWYRVMTPTFIADIHESTIVFDD